MLVLDKLPLANWLKTYKKQDVISDLIAGLIATIIMVPQGMAYALLAGVPAEYGLYCAILPSFFYAILGSSRSLSVGPAALISIMVASSVGALAPETDQMYLIYAVNISFLVGAFLLLMRLLRLGSMTNFISLPVISGFTSASAIIILTSQLKHLLGVSVPTGLNFAETIEALFAQVSLINYTTLSIGIGACIGLWYFKNLFPGQLKRLGLNALLEQALAKAGPMLIVLAFAYIVFFGQLNDLNQVRVVGAIPEGLPSLQIFQLDVSLWQALALPSLLIALMCFVTSISVGTTLANKRKERINANQELLALGAANLMAALSGTFALAASMSRSAVNHSAGAQTTIASIVCAFGVLITLLFLTPFFYYLPLAVLGAIVVMSVASMIELEQLKRCWRVNRTDAYSLVATFFTVLVFGIELGITVGILGSVMLVVYRASHPHMAVVGRVGNSEHFRNIKRHQVNTEQGILAIRVDESIYFSNVQCIEDYIFTQINLASEIQHIVLIFSSVSFIDTTALDAFEAMKTKLEDLGISLHLAEVKGPVMDQLNQTSFIEQLKPGQIFFTTDDAFKHLA
ncbi:SulP family inorganic anion transporter [Marinomonas sp. PE14-40]|uniref:SulP family inorganic anion transporter n=1 Tax=Marinomonas sp. PE14-40 TaxID=3060621 RepID=UPI003F6748DD